MLCVEDTLTRPCHDNHVLCGEEKLKYHIDWVFPSQKCVVCRGHINYHINQVLL